MRIIPRDFLFGGGGGHSDPPKRSPEDYANLMKSVNNQNGQGQGAPNTGLSPLGLPQTGIGAPTLGAAPDATKFLAKKQGVSPI